MSSISVRADDELKKEMAILDINWSEYIRESIKTKIDDEKRRRAGQELLKDLQRGKGNVPEGFINETIRRTRGKR